MSDEEFVAEVRRIPVGRLRECADVLSVSKPSLVRWRFEQNLPHASLRPRLVSVIRAFQQ